MARPMMKSGDDRQSQMPASAGASAGSPPERHGPPERLVGNIQQVPPTPTIPYTLGQTPRQQNRVLAISVTCWLIMTGVLFFAG